MVTTATKTRRPEIILSKGGVAVAVSKSPSLMRVTKPSRSRDLRDPRCPSGRCQFLLIVPSGAQVFELASQTRIPLSELHLIS